MSNTQRFADTAGSVRPPRRSHKSKVVAVTPSSTTKVTPSYFTRVYTASPIERIAMVKHGVFASDAKRLFAQIEMPQAVGFKSLNLPTATVNRKAKQGKTLSVEEGERVIGLARLVGQIEVMLAESGTGEPFDIGAWFTRWLTDPLPAFGGRRPADMMDMMEGQALVSSILSKMQSGVYA